MSGLNWPAAKRLCKVSSIPWEQRRGAQVPPTVTPLKQLTRGVPQPFGQHPAELAGVWGARVTPRCPLRPAEELAQGKEKALGLRQRLEAAVEQQRALRARGEQCEAQQRELEATL